ncbi:MAG: putative colanic acid biosynthesis acetyltransferase [Bacteroidia bacterium]
MQATDLSAYNNSWYNPGAGILKRTLWYCVNACFFTGWFPFNAVKVFLLRLFGARIGKGLVIKPRVNIKYPWKLELGDHVWIGEHVWIDNLDLVKIGNHCCLSQGAFILCGNHNYKKKNFDLMVSAVTLEAGVWIGAKATVCPGVTAFSHAVLTAGSVASKDLEAWYIYQGNPAQKVKQRAFE